MVDSQTSGNGPTSSSAGSTQLLSGGKVGLADFLKMYARLDAEDLAERDLLHDEILPDEVLRQYIKERGRNLIREYITSEKIFNPSESDPTIYVDACVDQYNTYIDAKNGSRPDIWIWEIQEQARADKRRDEQRNSVVSSSRLLYQAAIRAQSHLLLDPDHTPNYVEQIEQYIEIYKPAYEKYHYVPREEESRGQRLSRFLG